MKQITSSQGSLEPCLKGPYAIILTTPTALVIAVSSAFWADVPGGSGMASVFETTPSPAYLCPSE